MKNKKTIILIITLVILIGLTLLFIKKEKNKKIPANSNNNINTENQSTNQNTNQNTNTPNKYDEAINELAKMEANGKQAKTIITITDKEANKKESTINITDKDLEYIKTLDTTEGEVKEKAIKSKIYAREAIKMGLTLPQDTIEEIEKLSSSEEVLKYIQNNKEARERVKQGIATYLTESEYEKELNYKIADEIKDNNISIKNETIENKMKEYTNEIKNFKKIENPTNEERQAYLSKNGNLYYEIHNLYLEAIKNKYIIEIKE